MRNIAVVVNGAISGCATGCVNLVVKMLRFAVTTALTVLVELAISGVSPETAEVSVTVLVAAQEPSAVSVYVVVTVLTI